MRHLRALVTDKRIRSMWSILLCLSQRIINRTYKPSIDGVPNALVYCMPPDMDRGIFEPFALGGAKTPINSVLMQKVVEGHEALLDATSLHVLEEQQKLLSVMPLTNLTDFKVGEYVLVSYLTRPPSKLAGRWRGPYMVTKRQGNVFSLRDLTDNTVTDRDVSRLKKFVVGVNVDPQDVAAADLAEESVIAVLSHRGNPKNRNTLEFEVKWEPDDDVTWETWETVKKLALVNEYVKTHPKLKYLGTG